MADWARLARLLEGAGPRVHLSWSELEQLIGHLPRSALKHRAWWSGDRPHVACWRAVGYRLIALVPGESVTFVRVEEPGPIASAETAGPLSDSGPDILLVTCVKQKLDHPAAAKDLYISPLFRKQRRYAESSGRPWFILSAEHGLVAPDEWLAPYERYLPDMTLSYRRSLGERVATRLESLAGPLDGRSVEVHAGSAYVEAVRGPLVIRGARIVEPLRGLGVGQRLAWYGTPGLASEASTDVFVTGLSDSGAAVSPRTFLALDRGPLRNPGLYSWWVDEAGARDLSDGLGVTVAPGLVYAGLAGATRWPSGKRSTNTLWSRIAGMHLGKRHEFSTFRRTLGGILAVTRGWDAIDEDALTAWMHEHLKLVALPYPDADTLGRLERDVLARLDPPLNLQHMASTALRRRLKELRRPHAH